MSKPKGDEGREAFLRQAGKLYDAMIGRAGPASGDTFDDIEEQAEEAGRQLILKMLRERLDAEAKAEPEAAICAKCGRPMRRPKAASERNLDTASGTVPYQRRHAICDRCQASFSPSGQAAEDTGARGIGPPAAKSLRGQRRRVV
jgi:hypothetical protein